MHAKMEIAQIKLQFKRLEKHHELSLKEKDPVAFLDLTHTLRIFTDMKREIDAKIAELNFFPDFTNTVKNKELSGILKGNNFFSLPISSGVENSDMQVKGLTIINRELTDDEIKKLFELGAPISRTTQLSFTDWLGAGIVERGTPENKNHPKILISREVLIKRVANILGASHPSGMEQGDEYENRYDSYIRELHDMHVANGFPLTYYQLLEISSEVIRVFSPIFK
jgi:hypothetical protein